MRIGIFGSCVTRDLFEDPSLRPALVRYSSRSSLISAVAPPVALDPGRVRLESDFQRRCVVEDFTKAFLAQLPGDALDWLVVDLIDERFDVLRAASSYVTCSWDDSSDGIEEHSGIERVRRLTAEAAALLEDAAVQFAALVTAVVAPERIIVHRARWLTQYRYGVGLHEFAPDRVRVAEHHNAELDHGYDVLERELGGKARTIAIEPTRFVADADHHLGLEPYHYEAGYNAAAADRLRRLVGI